MRPAVVVLALAVAACGGGGPSGPTGPGGSSVGQPFSGSYNLRLTLSSSCQPAPPRPLEWRVQTTVDVDGLAVLAKPGGTRGVEFNIYPIGSRDSQTTATLHINDTSDRFGDDVFVAYALVRGPRPVIQGGRAVRFEGGFSETVLYVVGDASRSCVAADHRLVLEAL